MDRLVVIHNCDECPYFYDRLEECIKLNRKIKENKDCEYPIPEDCPLEKIKEDE